jgi:hypothetical protein
MIRVTTILCCVALPAAAYSIGCSSTATGGFSGEDGGSSSSSGGHGSSTSSSGGSSSGSGSSTSSTSSGGSTSSTSSTSSGGSSTSSGSSSGGSSSGCTPPATVTGVPTYTPVTAQKACSMADVTSFIADCDSATATQTTCMAWAPAAADTNCAACIEPANMATTGATIYDANGDAFTNQPGCVQLTDGNSTCAAPLYQALVCLNDACGSCTTQTDYDACEQTALMGACSAENTALSACQTDLADGGSANGGACSTTAEIIYKICGNGQ